MAMTTLPTATSLFGSCWSLRPWLGLLSLSCFCTLMIFVQHARVYENVSFIQEIEDAIDNRIFWNSRSTSTLSQPMDDNLLLAKYNLTAMDQHTKVKIPDANRTIAFIHIGKTGGSTISVHLRNGCHEVYMTPCLSRTDGWTPNETVASQRIEKYYHKQDVPPEKLDHFTTIMTVVRNPISRFLSAFAYGHPTNSFAISNRATHLNNIERQKYSCFPSISYLVKAGMGHAEIPWNKSYLQKLRDRNIISVSFGQKTRGGVVKKKEKVPQINCTELARIAFGLNESWAVANGGHPWLNHMSFDYRQYYRSMPPDKELIVLRSEHLWEDWVKVNHLLRIENDDAYKNSWPSVPPFQEIHRNVSHKYSMKERWKTQTSEEQLWLCQLLQEEIQTYLLIVMRAINLDEDDLLEAVSDVERVCSESVFLQNANSTTSDQNA